MSGSFTTIPIAVTGTSDNTLATPTGQEFFRICALSIRGTVAAVARFNSGTNGENVSGDIRVSGSNTGPDLPFNKAGYFETRPGALLSLEADTASAGYSGYIVYTRLNST